MLFTPFHVFSSIFSGFPSHCCLLTESSVLSILLLISIIMFFSSRISVWFLISVLW